MGRIKSLEELTLLDDFMFGQVMSRVDVGQRFLEQLFQQKIKNIQLVQSQSEHKELYNTHGVRFDVEFEGDGRFYNIEMQQQGSAGKKGKLTLVNRARFYHAALLQGHFDSGVDYDKVPATRVIFICNFDPFSAGDPVYFQVPQVVGHSDVIPNQEITAYLNVKYKSECVATSAAARELLEFLNYIRDGVTLGSNPLSRMASKAVAEVKTSYEGRRSYMSLQETFEQIREASLEEGEKKGVQKGKRAGLEEAAQKIVTELHIPEEQARRIVGLPPKGALNLDRVGE